MSTPIKINIKKCHPDAKLPRKGSELAAGFDVAAVEEYVIKPGTTEFIRTGVAFDLPENYVALLFPRGSLAIKKILDMPNSVGVGDPDFRGEYKVPLRNLGTETVIIEKHERIAQFVFVETAQVEFNLVDELDETKRGKGMLGSTGKI